MKQVSREEAVATIGDLFEQVERGEEVVITRDGKPLLRLVPTGREAAAHDLSAAHLAVESVRAFREKLAAEGKFFTLAEIRSAIDEGRRY